MALPSGFKTTIVCGIRSMIRRSSSLSGQSLGSVSFTPPTPAAVASSRRVVPGVGAGFRPPCFCGTSTCRLSGGICGPSLHCSEISVEGQRIRTGRHRPSKFVRAEITSNSEVIHVDEKPAFRQHCSLIGKWTIWRLYVHVARFQGLLTVQHLGL